MVTMSRLWNQERRCSAVERDRRISRLRRRKIGLLLGVALLAILGFACKKDAGHRSSTGARSERILTEDGQEWLNPVPKGIEVLDKPQIPRDDIYEVRASVYADGLVMLEHKPAVAIREVEARGLVGPCFHSETEKRPYLVRAVYCAQGSFDVYMVDGDIAIISWALGDRCPTYHKTALVLNLSGP